MISRIFIERPKLSFVISIVTVIAGVLCLFQVPVAEYPEIAPPQIMVSASYPGASAEVIAETVATVIESEANGIEDMIYFSSQSNNSGSYQLRGPIPISRRSTCRTPSAAPNPPSPPK